MPLLNHVLSPESMSWGYALPGRVFQCALYTLGLSKTDSEIIS